MKCVFAIANWFCWNRSKCRSNCSGYASNCCYANNPRWFLWNLWHIAIILYVPSRTFWLQIKQVYPKTNTTKSQKKKKNCYHWYIQMKRNEQQQIEWSACHHRSHELRTLAHAPTPTILYKIQTSDMRTHITHTHTHTQSHAHLTCELNMDDEKKRKQRNFCSTDRPMNLIFFSSRFCRFYYTNSRYRSHVKWYCSGRLVFAMNGA